GRQFNRERHTVKFSADVCYNGRFHVAAIKMGAACQCALHEQLDCRKSLSSRRSEPWGVRWTRKRIQSVNMLALNPESLAARGQNVDLWRCLADVCCQRGDRFHEMFAGIEDQ